MGTVLYLPPRGRRARRKPIMIPQNAAGELALIAAIVAGAINDYFVGSAADCESARWYFSSPEYRHHATALVGDANIIPNELRPFALILEV